MVGLANVTHAPDRVRWHASLGRSLVMIKELLFPSSSLGFRSSGRGEGRETCQPREEGGELFYVKHGNNKHPQHERRERRRDGTSNPITQRGQAPSQCSGKEVLKERKGLQIPRRRKGGAKKLRRKLGCSSRAMQPYAAGGSSVAGSNRRRASSP